MIAPLTERISWEAFERLPDDGMHRELIDGELIVFPPPKAKHTFIAQRLFRILDSSKSGVPMMEAGYKLTERPPSWVQPDVSLLSNERANHPDPDGYFQGSPELAIEVISPSETARDVNRKIDLLLAHGAVAVWVVYPDEEEVRIHLPDGTSYRRGKNASLVTPEVFGALEIPVQSLFQS